MRVAFAVPNFPPEFLGGTERVTLALARACQEQGDEVTVLCGSELGGTEVADERLDGIRVRRIPREAGEEYGLDLRRPRVQSVVDGVLSEGFDVLHVHHWATLTTGLVRGAAARGIPSVVTLHDMFSNCARFFRRPPHGIECPTGAGRESCVPCAGQGLPHLSTEQLVNGLADRDTELTAELHAAIAVTVPSDACRQLVQRHGHFDGDIQVVPHGLLEDPPADSARTERSGALRLGTFGNLVEEKGVLLLIWACRGLEGIELHLHGPFLNSEFEQLCIAKAAEFGVELRCHGGWGPSDPHPALALDVAVFPSLCEETYGLVVEEALVRGTPVVVSDRGALAERIGDGGRVVAVDDVPPLRQALRALTRPEALDELRRGIPDRFDTVRDAARRYRELYAAAMETR